MKIKILYFALCLLLLGNSVESFSQARFGVKAGVNLANQNYDNFLFEIDSKMYLSFMAGIVAEFDFSESIGFGTGLQYHGKGVKYDVGVLGEQSVSLNYLQVPFQFQFRKNGFFAAVGPYVGFALNGQFDDGATKEDLNFGNGADDDFAALDYGAILDIGYQFSNSLRLTGSYSLGLANLIPADALDVPEDASIKNSVIGVAVTYLFGAN
ncbi:MAG: PorT family protein [Bacteroidota bacterium]|nr:PorT family protein [Bacteroidota bacterium]